ncbi:MAG: hypothetical protein AAGA48_03875 [Myxococcota bacterium]
MLLLSLTACLADIRPDSIRSLTDETAAAERGRAMLESVAAAHGGVAAWNERTSVTVELEDVWQGLMAKVANPWPTPNAHVRLEQRLHSFDSRATFLGEEEGLVWGITNGQSWQVKDGKTSVGSHGGTEFMLPTMHYFTEIPYRLLEAPIAVDAGPETIDGVTYDRVFVTWEGLEPTSRFDQYVAYIDPKTGRLAKTFYTVREVARFVSGTMNYQDYVDIDGAWVPMTMFVAPKPADTLEDNLHVVKVKSFTFDSADPKAFEVPAL